ncbi:hypothetical protein I7I51_01329 [Histoplasma capsulatum]|uniref:MARVEL domain-containing protein n=2 Tax=Ajellomyces capsulatus TaxID=5037 RepID=F0U6B8_AJEC8|nr:conserved hypothetical protein [Histoplasma mississippiense (nom. inval.)]EGC41454.1 conserved hypothetical protein [Histoplasma capsulatum var. duboisii H88]KAG5298130.1 hypothetical protein I7I48_07491 [Histoplasma ohiense (nom. inval.)]QSS64264.1 hypothetical protein I7I51_01329 [Histoplasma capsulatum]EDN10620.1 conserved hypothetical protein [Histoplasma mississippiense (nom. inval.)]QSS52119.1 hypothetical protein I7I53_07636 [Histoplasma capsulatum var. duboisii H88]
MIAGFFFICWRIGQLVTLIIPIGILSWFVDGFVKNNQLTPTYILVLFIVSVLGIFWALDTLIRHSNAKRSAHFVAFVDLCFVGSFIAGVYQLRRIANADCGNFRFDPLTLSLGPFGFAGQRANNPLARDPTKVCAMLKTSFAFGIMNIGSFFITSILAVLMHHHEEREHEKGSSRRRGSHSSHRGHSGSRHRRSSSGRQPAYAV